jgi:hypothetical protein
MCKRAFWMGGMAILVLVGIDPLPAEERSPTLFPNATEACRSLGRWVFSPDAPLCHRPVYWVLGVDISGSGAWGWLDVARDLLRDWGQYVVVPGDRVQLVVFDDEVRAFGPWDVEDRNALLSVLLDPVRVREGHLGSAVDRAREKVLQLAARADHPSRAVCTLLLADRDSTDSLPGAATPITQSLAQQFGAQFVLWSAGNNAKAVERETELKIVCRDGQKIASLIVFHSLSRRAKEVPRRPDWPPRQIPASTSVPPPPPLPPDPWSGTRRWLRPLTIVIGLLGLLAWGGWLFSAEGGQLINKDLSRSSVLRWRPYPVRPIEVQASYHGRGFGLAPVRPGLEDALVAQARLANPFAWGPWVARLTALEGYEIRFKDGMWSPEITLGAAERGIEVRDNSGIVARGTVKFEPEVRVQKGWRRGIVLAGVWLVLWLLVEPWILATLPVPVPPVIEQPQPELLCDPGL